MRKIIVILGVVLIFFVLVGSVVLQIGGAASRGQVRQQQVWRVPIAGGEVETLERVDLTGDGQDEILAQTPGQLLVISPAGQVLFSQNVSNAKSSVGDLDGDGVEEFVLAEPEGDGLRVAAYTGDGALRWEQRIPGVGAPARGLTLDFEGDKQREVVLGTDAGALVCLAGPTGALRWQYSFPPDAPENLILRGTDDAWLNGRVRLAAAVYGGRVALLDEAGAPIWETTFPQPVRRLRAFDMNGDGTSEMLAGGLNGLLWLLSAAGDEPLWQNSIGDRVDEARFLEIDGNPAQREVVVGGKGGGLSAYTLSGASLWQRSVGGKVRELATLDYDDDGQNELLVAADRVYLLRGRSGERVTSFAVQDPAILEAADVGAGPGYLAGTSQEVSAFSISYASPPWWSSPITAGLLVSLVIAAATLLLSRLEWEKQITYSAEGQSLAALKVRKQMLRDILDETERVYRDEEMPAKAYLEKTRQERERLAAVEEQILKIEPNYQPEVMRCPACGAPLETGLDRCPYCNHVLL
jgi:outer membrane protein assembly factor BamB